ncbi:MAG: hypothetical protein EA379_08180 [Phycisphaerales bacterium]|nr:MAG: hypothetical protein EA379_08180 [Phycisphaerales bacterium]
MTKNPRPAIFLVLAVGFAGLGVWLGVRAVFPPRVAASGTHEHENDREELERIIASRPVFSQTTAPELGVRVTPETAERVAADVRDRVASLARSTPEVSALGVNATDALLEAVHEQARIYLSGSFELHWAFLERTGALPTPYTNATTDTARAEALRMIRGIFEATTEPYACKPISLDDVVVRARYIEGRGRPLPDDEHVTGWTTRPSAWPGLSGEPSRYGHTVIEVMWPVQYVRDDVAATVYFGIWFVYDAGDGTWKINQTRVYNPLLANIHVYPTY